MIGIYCIKNLVNNKVYIGQSVDVLKRFKYHKNFLRKNKHDNEHLQNAWNKYGEHNFVFLVIEECLENELNDKETYWVNYYGGINSDNNYNIGHTGGSSRMSEAQKIKIGLANKGKKYGPHSEEFKKKMSLLHKGNKYCLGKKHSEEHKKKISEGNKGKKISLETRKKLSDSLKKVDHFWLKGRKLTEEAKKKISQAQKGNKYWLGKHHSKEAKEKMSKLKKGKKMPPLSAEARTNIGNAQKKGPILGVNIITEKILKFDSAKSAGIFLNKKPTHISECLRKERKTAYGYKWYFIEEVMQSDSGTSVR